MGDIEEILKKAGKIVLKFMKMLLAKLGIFILIPIAICFIVVLAWFQISGDTAKSSSESAQSISSSTSITNGEITISDDIYDTIRKDLKDQNINPESYFLGKNDKCQDESGLTYLEKMVRAEVVSNYVDTGKGEIRGIVKIQRNGIALEYIELQELNNKITKANEKQKEGNVEDVLKYFSIDENWNLVVAKSNKYTNKDTSGNETVTYEVTSEVINYQGIVSQYTMPYEFLFILMEITNNPEYVSAVADLVLNNSEIILDIKDSTTTEETTITTEWEEETVVRKSAVYGSKEEAEGATLTGDGTKTKESKQQTSSTTNEVTTISVRVARVNTWIYNKEISYVEQVVTGDPINEETKMDDNLGTEKDEIKLSITGTMEETDTQYFKEGTTLNIINKTMTYTTTTSTTEWIADASSSEQIKTEDFLGLWKNKQGKYTYPSSEEYVDGINKYATDDDGGLKVKYKLPDDTYHIAIDNILNEYDSADIFFNLLDKCERTQNIETIMRYVLYKYTGKDYGVTEEELEALLSIFQDNEFCSTTSGIYGNSLADKIWYSLKALGYSDYAVAGVIANLAYESGGLSSNAIESNGVGIGLAQWSYGRREALEAYAASKGVEWTDEDTQIEFLIAEISGTGPAKDYATKQFANKSYNGKTYNEASWKNATSIEEATVAFCVSWERPKDPKYSLYDTPYKSRIAYAKEYHETYNGKTYGGDASVSTNGIIYGKFTSTITGKTYTIYLQNEISKMAGKSNWTGYCNRASSMCIVSGYTTKSSNELITEIDSYSGGGIPYANNGEKYFNKYGLTRSLQNSNNHTVALSAQLRSGGYALIHLKNNFKGKSGTVWAREQHWVAIIGYKNESGKEKIYITDSRNNNKSGWYDIDEFQSHSSGKINYLYFVKEK